MRNDMPLHPENDPENRVMSEDFDDFCEALEVLFILANISGRIKFAEKWPFAAFHVLGPDLMDLDKRGTEDRAHRAELEKQAETRRVQMLEMLDNIEDKTVINGVIQLDIVRDVVARLGRDCALYIYAPKIVNRFAPPPAPAISPDALQEDPSRAPIVEAPAADSALLDPMDLIQPILTGTPRPPEKPPEES